MFHETVYNERIQKLKKKLEPNTLYLFSDPSQITYFTGFEFLVASEREAFFVCSHTTATLIHTSFAPISNFDFLEYLPGTFPNQLKQHIEAVLQQTNVTTVLFDAKTLFVSELNAITDSKKIKTDVMPPTLATESMNTKDAAEIQVISSVCNSTCTTYEVVAQQLQTGMSELEVASVIEAEFKKQHCKELAFPTIVAFGPHSARPHHQPGDKKLEENMPVLIDMGARLDGYCADMTRTIWFGPEPDDTFQKIERIVLDAYTAAYEVAQKHTKKVVLAKDIDNAARAHISNQGFGDNFIHTTGHGVGLNIHETPSLSWTNSDQIKTHMVLTIEPGIYIEGNMGYRYENTVLMTPNGCKVLTQSKNI